MRVFRLSRKKYASELSGKGAAKFSNRWNSKGTEIIYSAESRALAMAEVAVHLTFATIPSDYMMIEIEIPDYVEIKLLEDKNLPKKWNNHPPDISTQKIGDDFIEAQDFCVLKVPSAVVRGDFNYLINPYHKHFKSIIITEIQTFLFDKRIFK